MAVTGFESRRERGVCIITLKAAGSPVISLAHYLDLIRTMTEEESQEGCGRRAAHRGNRHVPVRNGHQRNHSPGNSRGGPGPDREGPRPAQSIGGIRGSDCLRS